MGVEFNNMILAQQAYNTAATVFKTVDEMTSVAASLRSLIDKITILLHDRRQNFPAKRKIIFGEHTMLCRDPQQNKKNSI